MQISFTKTFQKEYGKMPSVIQEKFAERLELFQTETSHPLLRIHPLAGNRAGYWSMNITGDVRALYHVSDQSGVTFVHIGTHTQLYGK